MARKTEGTLYALVVRYPVRSDNDCSVCWKRPASSCELGRASFSETSDETSGGVGGKTGGIYFQMDTSPSSSCLNRGIVVRDVHRFSLKKAPLIQINTYLGRHTANGIPSSDFIHGIFSSNASNTTSEVAGLLLKASSSKVHRKREICGILSTCSVTARILSKE